MENQCRRARVRPLPPVNPLRPARPSRIRPPRTATAVLLTTVLLMFGVGAPAPAGAVDIPSTLVKSVRNATHPGAAAAEHGDTLDWTVATETQPPATPPPRPPSPITGGAAVPRPTCPARCAYRPAGAASWSTDGSTFTGTDPGAATTAVRRENPLALAGGTSLATLASAGEADPATHRR